MMSEPETPKGAEFDPAPDLKRPARFEGAEPLSPETASLIEGHLRGVDSVHVRVIGDDPGEGRNIAAHLLAKGFAVELTTGERMVPYPLSRHVFRYDGRTALLTLAPDA